MYKKPKSEIKGTRFTYNPLSQRTHWCLFLVFTGDTNTPIVAISILSERMLVYPYKLILIWVSTIRYFGFTVMQQKIRVFGPDPLGYSDPLADSAVSGESVKSNQEL